MNVCVACRSSAVDAAWKCERCGFEPQHRNGFLAFAPTLADQDDQSYLPPISELFKWEAANSQHYIP